MVRLRSTLVEGSILSSLSLTPRETARLLAVRPRWKARDTDAYFPGRSRIYRFDIGVIFETILNVTLGQSRKVKLQYLARKDLLDTTSFTTRAHSTSRLNHDAEVATEN